MCEIVFPTIGSQHLVAFPFHRYSTYLWLVVVMSCFRFSEVAFPSVTPTYEKGFCNSLLPTTYQTYQNCSATHCDTIDVLGKPVTASYSLREPIVPLYYGPDILKYEMTRKPSGLRTKRVPIVDKSYSLMKLKNYWLFFSSEDSVSHIDKNDGHFILFEEETREKSVSSQLTIEASIKGV